MAVVEIVKGGMRSRARIAIPTYVYADQGMRQRAWIDFCATLELWGVVDTGDALNRLDCIAEFTRDMLQ